jgi:uncharacterized membrane protein YgcG
MAFDSAADLLFNIGANTDDAEANVERFRALLGTDLDALGDQFADWSDKVFGDLNTVKGGMIGITAAAAAALVAAGAFAVEAGHHFEEMAIEVDNASKKTGIGIEQMSALRFTADELNIPFERLVQGITRFESSIYKANEGAEAQSKVFARLGISTKDVAAGEKDVLPLLKLVADRFHAMADGTEKAALLRELFARGGPDFVRFLNLGSDGMARMAEEAKKLGVVIGQNNVTAARDYEAALKQMHAQLEAIDIEVGEKSIPFLEKWGALKAATLEVLSRGFDQSKGAGEHTGFGIFADIEVNYKKMLADIDKVVAERAHTADKDNPLAGLLPPPGWDQALHAKIKEVAEDFHTLTDRVEEMRLKLAELQGPEAKLAEEMAQMSLRTSEANRRLNELLAEHKLAPGVYDRETAAWAELTAMAAKYQALMEKSFADKDLAEVQQYLDGLAEAKKALQEKIDGQSGDASYARQKARIAEEVEAERQKYAAEGMLDAEMEDLLAKQKADGLARVGAERAQSYAREMAAFQDHLQHMLEADMTAQQKLAAQHQIEADKLRESATRAQSGATPDQAIQIGSQYLTGQIALLAQQGFQSVFGNQFVQMIKQNESLSKEWSQSINQSGMLVEVSLESVKEQAGQAFDKLAEGMGGAIAHALVYGGSMGHAMRQATEAVLESIASQDIAMAINALGWGFYDLAVGNETGAAAAFTAAEIFGSIGLAAGVAGRAVAGSSGSSGAGGGAGGSGGSSGRGYTGGPGTIGGGGGSSSSNPQASASAGGVSVHVYGHVVGPSGIEQLCSMINDAVQNRDVRLVATQARSATPVTF